MRNPARFGRYYKAFAAILLNTVLVFILANLAISYVNKVRERSNYLHTKDIKRYIVPLRALYPFLKEDAEIYRIMKGWLPLTYDPFTQFKEKPVQTKYVHISENGFRETGDRAPWPPDRESYNIFIFGGSTTFGYSLPDDHTIPAQLQRLFDGRQAPRKRVRVYNFARGGYYSSQERVLFEKLLVSGARPDMAIFIDGLCEFTRSSYGEDAPDFTKQLTMFMEGRYSSFYELPILTLFGSKTDAHEDSDPRYSDQPDPAFIEKVMRRYLANKKIIEEVARGFGVVPVFVWQPVPTYKYDLKHHLFLEHGFGIAAATKNGYSYAAGLDRKRLFGDDFLWLADMQEDMSKPVYIDVVHYSAEMCRLIAERIHGFLSARPGLMRGL